MSDNGLNCKCIEFDSLCDLCEESVSTEVIDDGVTKIEYRQSRDSGERFVLVHTPGNGEKNAGVVIRSS